MGGGGGKRACAGTDTALLIRASPTQAPFLILQQHQRPEEAGTHIYDFIEQLLRDR